MKKLLTIILPLLTAVVAFVSCNSTPDNVIPPEEMARLLADVHKGEGVVDLNRSVYYNDSLRKLVKQSVYAAHGVTSEQVDTSFVWYGHHVEEYIKVYDRVIEILEQDLDRADELNTAEIIHFAVAGDSVDTWQSSRHYTFNRLSPANFVTFSLVPDDTWEKGDIYLWEFKTLNNRSAVSAIIAVDYKDGLTEYNHATSKSDGWTRVKLPVDSTRTPARLYGVMRAAPTDDETIFIDSIALIRTRVNPRDLSRRRIMKTFNYGKPEEEDE